MITKTCKKHGLLNENDYRIRKNFNLLKNKIKSPYITFICKKCANERQRKFRKNPTQYDIESNKARRKTSHYKILVNKYSKNDTKKLNNCYVRRVIKKQLKLDSKNITNSLIEFKRTQLLLKREIDKAKNDNENL